MPEQGELKLMLYKNNWNYSEGRMGAGTTTPLLHQLWVPREVAKSQVVLTCMSLMKLPFQRLPGMAGQRSHCTLLQP